MRRYFWTRKVRSDECPHIDPAKRALLFERADAVLAAEVVDVPLFQKPAALIQKSTLQGLGPSATYLGPFWNIQDWHWKR